MDNVMVLRQLIVFSFFLQCNCEDSSSSKDGVANKLNSEEGDDCWISLNGSGLATQLADLRLRVYNGKDILIPDHRFPVLEKAVLLNAKMQDTIVGERGAAERAIHEAQGDARAIPAGLNLGGNGMFRLNNSILFFHRLKLRNSTRFRIDYLHNEYDNFMVTMRLSLNDLKIFGSYERCTTTVIDQSSLSCTPTYGEVEFLLRNVKYKVEGRYRMIVNRVHIEHIISSIDVGNIFMTYGKTRNETNICEEVSTAINLETQNVEDFIANIKTSLDEWLKDYYNDFMIFNTIYGPKDRSFILSYDKQCSIILNKWTDEAINKLKLRMCKLNVGTVKIPSFFIGTTHTRITLKNGIIRGLDSFYRRSMATTKHANKLRSVDAKIGFSQLKVSYQYVIEDRWPSAHKCKGKFIMTADDLSALISISMITNPESYDIHIHSLRPTKPEFITMQGDGNRIIAKIRHVLEQQIMALMLNSLYHNVRLIGTLVDCEPALFGDVDPRITDCERKIPSSSSIEDSSEKVVPGDGGDFVLTRNESIELKAPENDPKGGILKIHHDEAIVIKQTAE